MSMIQSARHHDDADEDLSLGTNKQIETRTYEQDDGQPVQVLHGAAIEVEVVDAAIGVACAGLDEGALVGVGNLVAARVDWIVRHRSSSSTHHHQPRNPHGQYRDEEMKKEMEVVSLGPSTGTGT